MGMSSSVVDPDPVGSGVEKIARIRIRILPLRRENLHIFSLKWPYSSLVIYCSTYFSRKSLKCFKKLAAVPLCTVLYSFKFQIDKFLTWPGLKGRILIWSGSRRPEKYDPADYIIRTTILMNSYRVESVNHLKIIFFSHCYHSMTEFTWESHSDLSLSESI
jgi:hypothetical protein